MDIWFVIGVVFFFKGEAADEVRIRDWRSDGCSSDLGYLRVAARQSGKQVGIEVTDDGRGMETDRLVEKAISAKIITKEKAAALTEEGRLNLIFAPGLSTARQITSVSGRGVGMDVVQSNIERIGGDRKSTRLNSSH